MNAKKKIEVISDIIERFDEGSCLYCGSTLNGDLEDYDEFYGDDWCPDCCENIDPDKDWDSACIKAIDKVIHEEKFKP
ncbi:MAG: hypothetical protein KGD65_11225 [Candidatus Lokiarchaeota archaeon]|nr:hypothetical protein [Candidatus Lokiarchaeota archaeon]